MRGQVTGVERSRILTSIVSVVINFVQWSSIFTLFVFISLIITVASPFDPTRSRAQFDGQIIAIIIISGLFTLFTTSLYAAHVR